MTFYEKECEARVQPLFPLYYYDYALINLIRSTTDFAEAFL